MIMSQKHNYVHQLYINFDFANLKVCEWFTFFSVISKWSFFGDWRNINLSKELLYDEHYIIFIIINIVHNIIVYNII